MLTVKDLKVNGKIIKKKEKDFIFLVFNEFKGDSYEVWKNSQGEGKGIYYYVNSDKYKGEWKTGIN